MSDNQPYVWIVIPTWNRKDDLLACLASVERLAYPNRNVVVVDNGSDDGSGLAVRNQYPGFHLINLGRNCGAAAASNTGLEFAHKQGAEYFLRIDSDTVLDTRYLSNLVEAALVYPESGVFGGKMFYFDPSDVVWSTGAMHTSWTFATQELGRGQQDNPALMTPRNVDYLWSAGILIRKDTYEATGGFDTDFFVYYEDPDFCVRVRQAGFTLRYVPSAHLWHKVYDTKPSNQRAYQWGRGKMLFFRKHSTGLHQAALIIYCYLYAFYRSVVPKKTKGNRGPLLAALRGLTSGLLHPLNIR